MASEGDMVAMYNVTRGTHQDVFAGFPPTGKEVVLRGMGFIRISNGKMVELWNCQDTLSWVQQLGASLSFPEKANGAE